MSTTFLLQTELSAPRMDWLAAWETGTAMTAGTTMLAEMGGLKFTPGVYARASASNIAT
jgi:hypothetical protein